MKGHIIRISGGTIIEIANSDLLLEGENIYTSAAINVNETGDDGVAFN
ncbi:hypothetical protein [Maribacter luteus]|uniref:Uncharacterized protein n=1 Tax=Maribacter luteus TaxID=2594478 RepID=A0A6I2MQU2_9FLAO|nr:hypothetical protein [Maribacter luteus]MRX64885.1 hypothetical protein [Maribacter luteus]